MLRIKIPQGIVTASQMRALAGVAARYSRGFCHVTTRQNIQFHFVLLSVVEEAMRELADEGLTTREACGNSVRNITGCPYAGTSETEIFDVTPYAEAMTRYFLRHPLSRRRCRASSRSRSKGAPKITRSRRSTTSAGARASSTASAGSV